MSPLTGSHMLQCHIMLEVNAGEQSREVLPPPAGDPLLRAPPPTAWEVPVGGRLWERQSEGTGVNPGRRC